LYPRFLGSFGRTGSGEDVSDAGREQVDRDIQSPAEFWTAKIQMAQPGMRVWYQDVRPSAHNLVLLVPDVGYYFTRLFMYEKLGRP
jgi:hypothetical protein